MNTMQTKQPEQPIPSVSYAFTTNQSSSGATRSSEFVSRATLTSRYASMTERMRFLIANAENAMRPRLLRTPENVENAHWLMLRLNRLHRRYPTLLPKVHHCNQCRREYERAMRMYEAIMAGSQSGS